MSALVVDPRTERADVEQAVVERLADGWTVVDCATCARRLCKAQRGARPRVIFLWRAVLPEEDFCRWCARPISERGRRVCPLSGFLAFVRAVANDREPALRRGGGPA